MKRFFAKLCVLSMAALCILAGCSNEKEKADTSKKEQAAGKESSMETIGVSRLSTTNNRVVDENGNPYVIKGISTHGIAWFPEIINEKSFSQFKEDFGINTVRLAMYTAESGGYCTDGDQKKLEKQIDQGVELCRKLNMYCVIDWHILSDQDPLDHLPQAETFFEKMAKKYGKVPNVIFEICNEPNGNTTWEQVSEYANTIIPIIREHSQNLILVGTPSWSQDIDQAAKAPLDHENIAYTLHFYAATHKDDLRAKYESVVNKIPIVVSEFGICDASGNGTIDEESANAWMKLLDQYNTGRILWNASNKDESSSIFKPETDLTNWTLNDLSASGKWLLAQTKEQTNKTGTEKEQAKQAVKKTEHAKEVTLQIDQTNDWQENGKQFVQLNGTVTNQTSSTISSWQFRLAFPEPVRISDHWNCEVEQTDEKTIQIRNVDYNGKLESKKSATDVGLIVSSGSKVEINNIAIE